MTNGSAGRQDEGWEEDEQGRVKKTSYQGRKVKQMRMRNSRVERDREIERKEPMKKKFLHHPSMEETTERERSRVV
jgi:hypothetical protein